MQNVVADESRDHIAGRDAGFERGPRHVVNEAFQRAIAHRAQRRSWHADRRRQRIQLALKQHLFDNILYGQAAEGSTGDAIRSDATENFFGQPTLLRRTLQIKSTCFSVRAA